MIRNVFAVLVMFVILLMVSLMPAFAEPVDLMEMESLVATAEISGAPPGRATSAGSLETFIAYVDHLDEIMAISAGAEHILKEPSFGTAGKHMLQASQASEMIDTNATGHIRNGPQRSFPLLC